MSEPTAARLTVEEALGLSITEAIAIIEQVGPETGIGKALTILKIEAQRVQTGLPMRWLSILVAIDGVGGDRS